MVDFRGFINYILIQRLSRKQVAAMNFKGLINIILISVVFFNFVQTCPTKCHCQDEKLFCERSALTSSELEAMVVPSDITEVHLTGNGLKQLSPRALQNFKHVSILEISNNEIKEIPANIFNGFNNLKNLILDSNKLTSLSPDSFKGLINLRRLEIRRNQITDIQPGIFDKLYFLQIIRLQENKIQVIKNGVFTQLKWLRDVFLAGNLINTIEDKAFQNLTLNILGLSDNKLERFPVSAFKGLSISQKVLLLLNPLDCECREAMNYAANLKHLNKNVWGYCASPDYAVDKNILNAHVSMLCTLCDLDPCQNGGTCIGNKTHFKCKCPEKFKGETCEISICNGETKYITKIVKVPGKTLIKYVEVGTNIPLKQTIVNRTEYIVVKENIINGDDQQKLKILYAMCTLEFVVILCFVVYFVYTRYKDWKLRKKYEHEKSRKILLNIRNSTNAKLAKSLCESGDEEFPFDVKNMILKGSVPV